MKVLHLHNRKGGFLPPYYYLYNKKLIKLNAITFSNYYEFHYYYTIYIELLKRHGKYSNGIVVIDQKLKGFKKLNTEKQALKYAKLSLKILSRKVKLKLNNFFDVMNDIITSIQYDKIVDKFEKLKKDDNENCFYVGEHKINKGLFLDWNIDSRYRLFLNYAFITYDDFLNMRLLEFYDTIDSLKNADTTLILKAAAIATPIEPNIFFIPPPTFFPIFIVVVSNCLVDFL